MKLISSDSLAYRFRLLEAIWYGMICKKKKKSKFCALEPKSIKHFTLIVKTVNRTFTDAIRASYCQLI